MSDEPTQPKRGKSVFLGMAADDDPIYESGWKFIMGTFLNPNLVRTEEPPREDEAPPVPSVPDGGEHAE